ncbi:MAG TPA: hypothetical protein VMV14_00050 [Acidimicrobiales bacterium]|nr:hypothetical protein [Acidimicrobiales bacterium]
MTPKGTSKRTPRSAVDGLRSLAGPRRRSGGGGGGSRPGRPTKPGGGGGIDLRNTWQILLGSVLVPLGVVFILVAWYGSAHTAYIQQQIPYLVSGSFIGLGCLVLGGLLYWAHWLYRIYDQADLHHEEQMRIFEQVLRAAAEGGRSAGSMADTGPVPVSSALAGAYGAPPPPPAATGGVGPSYVVTPSGSVYHQPNCPVIAHHTEGLRVLGAAAVADMDPCRICLPSA